MLGHIYILKNNFIPNLVKIGYTQRDPQTRRDELSSFTGVPGRFEVVFSWQVSQADEIERKLFSELAVYRRTGEFFELAPTAAIAKIRSLLMQWAVIGHDGLSYDARKLKQQEEERQQRLEIQRIRNVVSRDLRHAIRAIYDELMKATLEASRVADEKTKPRGFFSFLSTQDDEKRIAVLKERFEENRLAIANRLKLEWITGDPRTLPFSMVHDYRFKVPGGPYGDDYRIPAGTTVLRSDHWISRDYKLINTQTKEEISGHYKGYVLHRYKSTYNPFSFAVISKDLRVLVGDIAHESPGK